MSHARNIMRMATAALLATTLVMGIGCGSDSPSSPSLPALPSPGSGTATLFVEAAVKGEDVVPGVFVSFLEVTLRDDAGVPVSGALVTMRGPMGLATLREDFDTAGFYSLELEYASGAYTLNVVSGTDEISGVRVIAPRVHTITNPLANSTVPADEPLNVTWVAADTAAEAWIESRDYESGDPDPDLKTMQIPGAENPDRVDQRIRVFRQNRVEAAGGLAGSSFKARLRNTVEPVHVQ